jgi:hypothetical protein
MNKRKGTGDEPDGGIDGGDEISTDTNLCDTRFNTQRTAINNTRTNAQEGGNLGTEPRRRKFPGRNEPPQIGHREHLRQNNTIRPRITTHMTRNRDPQTQQPAGI